MKLNLKPTKKMPLVAGLLQIIDLDTRKYGGYGVLKLEKHKTQMYLNIICKHRMKIGDKYQDAGEYSVRLPITMMSSIIFFIKKKFGLNYKGKKRQWEIKTYETI